MATVASAAIIYTNKAVEQRQRTIDKQLNEIKQEAKQQSQQQKLEIEQKIKDLEAKLQAKKDAQEAQKRSLAQKVVDTIVPVAHASEVPQNASHRDLLLAAGIAEADLSYAEFIINHENGLWCADRSYGMNSCGGGNVNVAYGICQANPGTKMAEVGADWRYNVVTQLRWCNKYAAARYGGWYNAYVYWQNNRVW